MIILSITKLEFKNPKKDWKIDWMENKEQFCLKDVTDQRMDCW